MTKKNEKLDLAAFMLTKRLQGLDPVKARKTFRKEARKLNGENVRIDGYESSYRLPEGELLVFSEGEVKIIYDQVVPVTPAKASGPVSPTRSARRKQARARSKAPKDKKMVRNSDGTLVLPLGKKPDSKEEFHELVEATAKKLGIGVKADPGGDIYFYWTGEYFFQIAWGDPVRASEFVKARLKQWNLLHYLDVEEHQVCHLNFAYSMNGPVEMVGIGPWTRSQLRNYHEIGR